MASELSEKRYQILKDFLSKWNPENVKKLNLHTYAIGDANYKETFTQWIERNTDLVGRIRGIGGGGSFKFGIYFKDPKDTYDSKKFKSDNLYAWDTAFGESRDQVFSEIKERIIKVINYSLNGDFEAIENVDKLFSLVKWKIAFLYSNFQLLPVYSNKMLQIIASGLGYTLTSKRSVDLQKYIIEQKPVNIDFFDWYEEILQTYLRGNSNYYVVGSSYGEFSDDKLMDVFYSRNLISIGFFRESLEKYYLKGQQKIIGYLKKRNEPANSIEALKNFLNIKEGDVIAIKYYGNAKNLKIAAYAVVKPDFEGNIYKYDDELRHTLNVEFIEKKVDLNINLIKTHSVHLISDPDEINTIFGGYRQPPEAGKKKNKPRGRKGTTQKNTSGHVRTVNYSVTINGFHDKLQQQFYEYLKEEKNDLEGNLCKMEEDFVDVSYIDENIAELYEVKPSPNPKSCIRDSLGQILYYASIFKENKPLKLFVVGPNELQTEDSTYLEYVKKNLKVNLEYIYFSG